MHPEGWVLAWLLVSATTLVSAIGLLRRSNRARIVFVAMLALGICWSLVSPFLAFGTMPTGSFGSTGALWSKAFLFMGIATTVVMLGLAALFGWLAWRLCSPEILSEFWPRESD